MFFITCFSKIEKNNLGHLDIGANRVFGFYPTFELVEESLNINNCDMWEFLYDYAIVEEMNPGIHPDVQNRWFFKYDREKNGFFKIEEPEEFKGVCNFALG